MDWFIPWKPFLIAVCILLKLLWISNPTIFKAPTTLVVDKLLISESSFNGCIVTLIEGGDVPSTGFSDLQMDLKNESITRTN